MSISYIVIFFMGGEKIHTLFLFRLSIVVNLFRTHESVMDPIVKVREGRFGSAYI